MKYGDSQWLTIGEKLRDESPAKIEGKIITSNQLQIKTQNVKSYTIRFEVLGGHPQDWQIESNGVRLSPNAEVVTVDGAPSGKIGTRKVALREGPIVDAFASSFVIVPGTLGGLAERSATDTVVQQLRQQWKTTYYAELPVKADYQITAADRDNTNLILIGNEHTNQILRRLHEALTVHTDVKGVTLGGTRFAGNAIGFSLIKPNPEKDDVGPGGQVFQDFEAVHAGHLDIEENSVGAEGLNLLDGLKTVGCLPGNGDAFKGGEKAHQAFAGAAFVVDDQDSH